MDTNELDINLECLLLNVFFPFDISLGKQHQNSCNFFYLVKCFYFNNSPFTTLQNNVINNQLQVGSIRNKLIQECL